ncbi:MAG: hypothetical protein KDD40_10175, partial [Bdellovibrionales bacterium]|nr:hypothetical protein [Bdellovibrionales bacterium]
VEEIQTERVIQKIRERFPDKEPSLDLLIAKDSGLPSRTFVGPMVLLEIQGGADVRPTDSMNICETDDCNFLERNNPELQKRVFPHDKKFYSNMNHLSGQTVDTLTATKQILDLKYKNQKIIESLLHNYLEKFNLTLISNEPEDLKVLPNNDKFIHCPHANIEQCLTTTNDRTFSPEEFISLLNTGRKKGTINSISDFYSLDKIKELKLSARVCNFVADNIKINAERTKKYNPRFANLVLNQVKRDLKDMCNEESAFTFNKIVRTHGINKFHFLGGKTVNFDLGSANSIEFAESFARENTVEANPLSLLSSYFKVVGNIINGFMSLSVAGVTKQEHSYAQTSELTSTTYLAMQRATFDINFSNPLLCIEARPVFNFAEKAFNYLNDRRKNIDFNFAPLTEGYIICDVEQSAELNELYFREKYYYFAQHFTEGHMLDDGSILNHPWLMGLRGERDYNSFVKLLGIKPINKKLEIGPISEFFKWVTSPTLHDKEKLYSSFTENNLAELPLDQISQAFDNVLPSFPGIYAITPQKKEYPYD